jgi:hypothetical protein
VFTSAALCYIFYVDISEKAEKDRQRYDREKTAYQLKQREDLAHADDLAEEDE